MDNIKVASAKTIARLSIYRRLLRNAMRGGQASVYSHELAEMVGVTAAQVRRDMMEIGFSADSRSGYNIREMIGQISRLLDSPEGENVAIIGMGKLGCALFGFFAGHSNRLKIVAAFDNDPGKAECVISGCRCHAMNRMKDVFARKNIQVVMLAVPEDVAQDVAETAVAAGAKGILNFAPVLLRLPDNIIVQNIDMMVELEKVSYVTRENTRN